MFGASLLIDPELTDAGPIVVGAVRSGITLELLAASSSSSAAAAPALDNAAIDIQLIAVTSTLISFAEPNVIPDALNTVDIVVVDGSFLPTKDATGVVVAAVCERADPRQSMIGDGAAITVWHPSLAAVLRVTDPTVSVDVDSSLIDAFDDLPPCVDCALKYLLLL
jgi:hypothetical protein